MSESRRAAILVIDDDKNQRSMLSFSLRDHGYDVVAAAGGEEAVSELRARPFQAAVCDVKMPGMDGLETLRRLKEANPGLKVVMATGYATAASAAKSMRLGAVNYLAKPYELGELFAVLERALSDADPGPPGA